MAQQARSSMPTVAEKVSHAHVGDPKVKGYAYSEYVGRKPGYVSSNPRAGAEWGALANTLDKFYGTVDRIGRIEQDKRLEKSRAEGNFLYDGQTLTEGEIKNMVSWRKFIEKNPEYANADPWVQRGYEESRLRELGLEYRSGLNKAMYESNALESDDPTVLQTVLNDFDKTFRTERGLDNYEDKILMAKHFSPIVAQARQSATTAYDTYKKNSRQDKFEAQISSEVSTLITSSVVNGTPIDGEAIAGVMLNAKMQGLMADPRKVVINSLRTSYAQTGDRDVLELVKNIEIDGVNLFNTTAGAEWYQREVDEINRKAKLQEKEDKKNASKFYGAEGQDLTYTYADKFKEFRNESEMIASVENELGYTMTLQQRMDFIDDVNKIHNKIENARENFRKNPMNSAETQQNINDAITSAPDKATAITNFNRLYTNTGDSTYREWATKLTSQEADKYWKDMKEVKTKAEKELDDISKTVAQSWVAQAVEANGEKANKYNASLLESKMLKGMRPVFNNAFSEAYSRFQSEDPNASPLAIENKAYAEAIQYVRDRATAGYFVQGLNPESFRISARNDTRYNKFFDPEIKDPNLDAQIINYVDTSDAWLMSNENIMLAKVPLRDFAGILDIQSMAFNQVDIKDLGVLVDYIKLPENLGISDKALSPDGKIIELWAETLITEDQYKAIENCLKQRFPKLEDVKVYQPAPKPKQTNIPLYDWSAN